MNTDVADNIKALKEGTDLDYVLETLDSLDRSRRRAAYRLAAGTGVVAGWTPIPGHGARIVAGQHTGFRGFVRPCDDGCDGWQVRSAVDGLLVTCLPVEWIAPVLTFRGGVRCPEPCCTPTPPTSR